MHKQASAVRGILFMAMLLAVPLCAAAEDFTDATRAYLRQCVQAEGINAGVVVGFVDEHGSRVVCCGKLDNGTGDDVNADTLFEVGSVTKTFTALLLQDMIERGQMKLDDPVAMYLPASVHMPSRNGRQITLLQLATHTSGLPREPDDLDQISAENRYADFSDEKLYSFLSAYQLIRDPGTQWEYSNLGVGLLGDAIAVKAGTDYESLVTDRICRPLGMNSTRITLTPELEARLAVGHDQAGTPVAARHFGALYGCGALRSTANDMLKYLSANLGLTPSSLTPLMEKTHAVQFRQANGLDMGLTWWVSRPKGTWIVWHGGDTGGFLSFIGLDKTRRRGVVVLANSRMDTDNIGEFLLNSEWQSDRRPSAIAVSAEDDGSFVGQYRRAPDFLPAMARMRHLLLTTPTAAFYIAAAFGLAILLALICRVLRLRGRWIVLGAAVLCCGMLGTAVGRLSRQAMSEPVVSGIGIRLHGNQVYAEVTGLPIWPLNAAFPPGSAELLPEADARFFERVSGIPTVTFTRDGRGNVDRLILDYLDHAYAYDKTSAEPPAQGSN